MSEYDSSAELYRLRREFDKEPELGEDWRDVAFNGDSEVGFARAFGWELVGNGVKKDEQCGKFKRFDVCLRVKLHNQIRLLNPAIPKDAGYVKRIYWSCNRPSCPVCFKRGWAVREADRIETRLLEISKRVRLPVEHIICSVPQELYGCSYRKVVDATMKALSARGIVGGVRVFHAFRYHHAGETFEGELAGWNWSLHFHVLGFVRSHYQKCRGCEKYPYGCRECDGFEGVTRRAFEGYVDDKGREVKGDGFIVKIKEERKTVGGTAWYQLNHASLPSGVKNYHVAQWFGNSSYRKMKIVKKSEKHKNLCKICGLEMSKGKFNGNFKLLMASVDDVKRSEGFVVSVKDESGGLLWECVHDDGG